MREAARIAVIGIIAVLTANSLHQRLDDPLILLPVAVVTVAFWLYPRLGDVSLGIVAAVLTVCLFLPGLRASVEVFPPVWYAAYLASSSSRLRRLWLGLLLAGTGAAAGYTALSRSLEGNPFPQVAALSRPAVVVAAVGSTWIVLGFFWLLGTQARRRREDLALLRERAALAGVLERTRIAREMHDIVAHSLSGILALSDGARYAAAKDPQVAVETLEVVSRQSRTALENMRGLLSVLRTEETGPVTSGARDLDTLLTEARRAGLEVEVTGELPELAELAQFTVYRVVQEMLSNMLRHATGPGTLRFDTELHRLRITSANPGGPRAEGGHGLPGMRERVRALGGDLTVEEGRGTFTVTAEVPT